MAKKYHQALTNFSFWYWEYLRRNQNFIEDMDEFYQHFAERRGDDHPLQLLSMLFVRICILDANVPVSSLVSFVKDVAQSHPAVFGNISEDEVYERTTREVDLLLNNIEKYGGIKKYNDGPSSGDLLNCVLGFDESLDLADMKKLQQDNLMFLIRDFDRWHEFVQDFKAESIFTLLVTNRLQPTFKQNSYDDIKKSTSVLVALNCWRSCFKNSLIDVTNTEFIPIGDEELDTIYNLLFSGKRLVEADEPRAVGVWLWDKVQIYGNDNVDKSFLKAYDELAILLNKSSGPTDRFLIKTNAREIYEITDECIKNKQVLHVVAKKSQK